MSRKSSRDAELERCAKSGLLYYDGQISLFKSEIRSLQKDGFTVTPLLISRRDVPCQIDWSDPFPHSPCDRLPIDASDSLNFYVMGVTDELYMEGFNFAQRLWAIASRARNQKVGWPE